MRLILLLLSMIPAFVSAYGQTPFPKTAAHITAGAGIAHALAQSRTTTDNILFEQNMAKQSYMAVETFLKKETAAKEQENRSLKAAHKKHELAIRHQRVVLALSAAVIFLSLVLLLVLFQSRKRWKKAFDELQQAHELMQAQQTEIIRQKNELMTQSVVLRAQNEQLEQHKQFRTKIFSIISHDLRAPFNSLKGVLRLVLHKSLSESQLQHVVGLLSRDVEAAADMLHNLLVWSQAQLEEARVRLEPVNLQQLVQDNIAFAETQAGEKNIRILSGVSGQAVVQADREMLNFVVRNLLMNAVKFTHEQGQVEVNASVQENRVTILVSDNGKGIPSEQLPLLFTDERVTTPGTRNEKGTGLGLMLCREFIESQNGTICAESEEGKGSVFSVTLQRVPACASADEVVSELAMA